MYVGMNSKLTAVTLLICCAALSALYGQFDPAMQPGTTLVDIGSSPEKVHSNGSDARQQRDDKHRLGWQYHLFKLNIPLAWNLSNGREEIIIGFDDDFVATSWISDTQFTAEDILEYIIYDMEHPDLVWKKNLPGATGNFRWITHPFLYTSTHPNHIFATQEQGASNFDFGTQNKFWDGTCALYGGPGHGYGIFSVALALANGTGMVGIAPECSGFATSFKSFNYHNIDVDPQIGGVQVPDVWSTSYLGSPDEKERFRSAIDAGVVVVAATGNGMEHYSQIFSPSNCADAPGQRNYGSVAPRAVYPAAFAWADPNNPNKDIKVIAVGIVNEGEYIGPTCAYNGEGGETFPKNFNYSPGRTKFSTDGAAERERQQEFAFVDLVVYNNDLVAFTIGRDPATSPEYRQGDGVTSRASPQVSGTVALMRSINKYLSSDGSQPTDLADVQRNAYKILTFTARKVLDAGVGTNPEDRWYIDWGRNINALLPGHPCWNEADFLDNDNPPKRTLPDDYPVSEASQTAPADFEYSVALNGNNPIDPLQRSWSPRFGFGIMDSYRAVAHAIIDKGDFEYTASTTLAPSGNSQNDEGRHLIHFGSRTLQGANVVNVLEQGGRSFPGGANYANNHGETRINAPGGTGIDINIPANTTTAIDGILWQTAVSKRHNRIVTQADGKILISGYLEDIELVGNLEVGDLEVHQPDPQSGAEAGLRLNGSNAAIFGDVKLLQHSRIKLDAGMMTVRPGGSIELRGDNDLVVENGATLIMEYPSRITGDAARKVLIRSGGRLLIKQKPSSDDQWQTEILCRLDVDAGGILEIEDHAFVRFADISLADPTNDVVFGPEYQARIDVDSPFLFGNGQTEIYGNWTIGSNLILSQPTYTLKPSGSIRLGTNTLTIAGGTTLEMEYPSSIVGDQAARLIVENGATLHIKYVADFPSSGRFAPTRLQVPGLYVESGGTIIVDQNARVEFQHFDIDRAATFFAKPGAHIILAESTNYVCDGRFIVDVSDAGQPRVSFSGPSACNLPTNLARLHCRVNGKYEEDDINQSYLQLQYADFSNVIVEVGSIPVAPVRSCSFGTSRKLAAASGIAVPALFKINFRLSNRDRLALERQKGLYPGNVQFIDCHFSDSDGDLDVDFDRNNDDYPIGGIMTQSLVFVDVEGCTFDYVSHALNSMNSLYLVTFKDNVVNTCNYGLHDEGSAVLYCGNVLNKVEFGSAFSDSRVSGVYDNTFNVVGRGIRTAGGPRLNVRNNVFVNYAAGIFSDGRTELSMTNDADGTINGFNDFILENKNDLKDVEFLQPELQDGQLVRRTNTSRDIEFFPMCENQPSCPNNIILECGFNMFGFFSRHHLINLSADPAPGIEVTINVDHNQWNNDNPLFSVRLDEPDSYIIPDGTVIDEERSTFRNCSVEHSELLDCNISGIIGGRCDPDAHRNIGKWTEFDLSQLPILDAAYWDARAQMTNPTVTENCRRTKMFDALESATLIDLNESHLRPLLTEYQTISVESTASVSLKATALTLKGEVHERLNESSAAISVYTQVLTLYQNEIESFPAAWRLQQLMAEQDFADYGEEYYQALADRQNRVLVDMRNISMTGGGAINKRNNGILPDQNAAAVGAPQLQLAQNAPNPFSESTVIRFTLEETDAVRLVVTDALGNTVVVLAKGVYQAGSHTLHFETGDLASGVYHYRLETRGQVLSRHMLIAK